MIQVENLSRCYGGVVPVEALREASFTVERGEFVVVVGPSGSGKSTLFNLLGLLDRPTSGRYLLEGRDTLRLTADELAQRRAHTIGFVFQSFHLLATRSALENVALGALYAGRSEGVARRAGELLDMVGLAHRAHSAPGTLSGGERQRVAVARALINQPPLLLCDEPTGNLDSGSRDTLLTLLGQLRAGGTTVMVITHDEQVARVADRRLGIYDGMVEAVATGAIPEPR